MPRFLTREPQRCSTPIPRLRLRSAGMRPQGPGEHKRAKDWNRPDTGRGDRMAPARHFTRVDLAAEAVQRPESLRRGFRDAGRHCREDRPGDPQGPLGGPTSRRGRLSCPLGGHTFHSPDPYRSRYRSAAASTHRTSTQFGAKATGRERNEVSTNACRAAQTPTNTDCKSVGLRVRTFESCTCHCTVRPLRVQVELTGPAGLPRASRGRGCYPLNRAVADIHGHDVAQVLTEVGSGANGKRPKLARVLSDPSATVPMLVEHRDRLAGLGVEHCGRAGGPGPLVVVVDGQTTDDWVRDMIEVLTSMWARLDGRRGARNRALRAVTATRHPEPAEAAG